jgi:ABC-type lipoprotein release transport system permease subunit
LGTIPREASILKVVGFFEIGMYEYDTSLVFMPMELLTAIFRLWKKYPRSL